LEIEKLKVKFENEEKFKIELQEREKALWEERLKAEIKMTEKKLEMETAAKVCRSKLPELKITPRRPHKIGLVSRTCLRHKLITNQFPQKRNLDIYWS
jgi:hypothetical protein